MRVLQRAALALAVTAAVLVPTQVAGADAPDAPGRKVLAQPNHGQAAIRALGENLDEVAALNDLSAGEFEDALTKDQTLWVGQHGRLHYRESADVTGSSTPEVQAASAVLEDTFLLHSREQSNHVIYLDFGGATITSTSWWVTDGGMSARTATGYSQDGDPAFNDTEKTYIQQVWRIVAEKYAAFDVDVTTENPGSDGYNRTTGGDQTWGDRVVFSSDDAAMADACGCPGTAFINTFDGIDSGQAEPTWVFTDLLGSSAALAANVAAHEVGHTVGLGHDGISPNDEYYDGHNQWVPIMGTTIARPVVQFSKGEYTNATNHEDDLATIAAGGAPLLADDHQAITGTPTVLPTAASYQVAGLITAAADQDAFAITRDCSDPFTATATGIGVGSTLDLKVSVYDSDRLLIGADDPASYRSGPLAYGMDAQYTVADAGAGTYYVEIDGVGSGGLGTVPDPSTGYTDYGSIGGYTLAITGCSVGNDPPSVPQNLTASPVQRSTNGSVTWTAPVSAGDSPITGYTVTGLSSSPIPLGPDATSASSTSLVPGTTYPVSVVATNAYGDSPAALVNLRVSTWLPTAAPVVTPSVTGNDAGVTWGTVANPGKATITGWSTVLKRNGITVATSTVPASNPRSRSYSDLQAGNYTFTVTVVGTADLIAGTTAGTTAFTIAAPPGPPRVGTPSSGITGGAVTAIARWATPSTDGGSPITGYKVIAYKLTAAGKIAKAYYSPLLSSAARAHKWTTVPTGRYKFKVLAYNALGKSPASAYSTIVLAR